MRERVRQRLLNQTQSSTFHTFSKNINFEKQNLVPLLDGGVHDNVVVKGGSECVIKIL